MANLDKITFSREVNGEYETLELMGVDSGIKFYTDDGREGAPVILTPEQIHELYECLGKWLATQTKKETIKRNTNRLNATQINVCAVDLKHFDHVATDATDVTDDGKTLCDFIHSPCGFAVLWGSRDQISQEYGIAIDDIPDVDLLITAEDLYMWKRAD